VHFNIKTIVLSSLLILSSQADDKDNKSKVFEDKYLDSQRLKPYQNSNSANVEYKISNVKDMIKVDDDTNATVSQMIKKQLDKNSMQNEATIINDRKNSQAFQKEVLENEEYLLYDKEINWQQHLGKHRNRSNKIIETLKEKGSVSASISSNQYLGANEKIFIVISSSIPKHIIQNYFEMLQKVNTDVTFILRGTIGGVKKIMPTLNWIKELLSKQGGTHYEHNVIIDPRVASKYQVERVPAVLYIKDYDSSYIKEVYDEEYYIYYGAVDVDYALEKINIDVKSEGLSKFLKNI
jgi:type-F conjugative transfer system pilin assembly protein TrbC